MSTATTVQRMADRESVKRMAKRKRGPHKSEIARIMRVTGCNATQANKIWRKVQREARAAVEAAR